MAYFTAKSIVRDGLDPALGSAAAGGDAFINDGATFIEVDNAGVGSINVTIVTQKTIDAQAVADRVVAVPNGERRFIGPFQQQFYNDGDDKVQITYSAVTSVTVGAFKLT